MWPDDRTLRQFRQWAFVSEPGVMVVIVDKNLVSQCDVGYEVEQRFEVGHRLGQSGREFVRKRPPTSPSLSF